MKIALPTLMIAVVALAGVASTAPAETMDEHKIVPAQEIKWGPGPAALPPGAQAAALWGDSSKEGLYVTRVKFPQGYHIPPHSHSKPEIVTVISGEARLGMGETADEAKARKMSQGSFMAMPPGTTHYVYVDQETVVQLNSVGPWEVNYVNPKDDPRHETQ